MSQSYNRPITHKEYLQMKYSSIGKNSKIKKKTRLAREVQPNIKIIDDDIDFRKSTQYNSDERELYYGIEEEKPIITAIIDERPLHMRNNLDRSKWKVVGSERDNDNSNLENSKINNSETVETKKTLAGKKAGLSEAKEIKKEVAQLKIKNEKMFSKMDDEISGKNAKTVFRDKKTGKIREIEKELEEKRKKDEEKAIRDAEKKAVYDRWSKGLVQREEQIQKIENDLHEFSKPLARYEDDSDLDKLLREREREDDPMLKEIHKKREEERIKDPNYKVYPKYQGVPPPPNRFNIPPGYRWDGVDRSNGYETKYFAKISDKEATQEEAYQWSVQDM